MSKKNEGSNTSTSDVVNETKEQAKDLSNKAQQKAQEVTEQAKSSASDLVEEAKVKASGYAQEAQQKAHSAADQRKDDAASQLSSVASGLREAGRKFQDEDQGTIGQYADTAADKVEDLSNYLRDHSAGDLLHDVEGFARQQPEVFLAGALAAGFFLGRFLKSSGRRSHSSGYGSSNAGGYRQQSGRSSAYDSQRYDNRPGGYGYSRGSQGYGQATQYDDRYETGQGRTDQSSAIGSAGTVTRTADAADVDDLKNRAFDSDE